jgi:hypothetical protein
MLSEHPSQVLALLRSGFKVEIGGGSWSALCAVSCSGTGLAPATGEPAGKPATLRYHATQREDEDALTRPVVELASQYGRYT